MLKAKLIGTRIELEVTKVFAPSPADLTKAFGILHAATFKSSKSVCLDFLTWTCWTSCEIWTAGAFDRFALQRPTQEKPRNTKTTITNTCITNRLETTRCCRANIPTVFGEVTEPSHEVALCWFHRSQRVIWLRVTKLKTWLNKRQTGNVAALQLCKHYFGRLLLLESP